VAADYEDHVLRLDEVVVDAIANANRVLNALA